MKKHIFMRLITLVVLLSSTLQAAAQEPYAVLSQGNKVLTFYYDNMKETRGGLSVGSFNDDNDQPWYDARASITMVSFNASFAYCTSLTSTAYWFAGCNHLTNISGIQYLKTNNVTSMSDMFNGCSD